MRVASDAGKGGCVVRPSVYYQAEPVTSFDRHAQKAICRCCHLVCPLGNMQGVVCMACAACRDLKHSPCCHEKCNGGTMSNAELERLEREYRQEYQAKPIRWSQRKARARDYVSREFSGLDVGVPRKALSDRMKQIAVYSLSEKGVAYTTHGYMAESGIAEEDEPHDFADGWTIPEDYYR